MAVRVRNVTTLLEEMYHPSWAEPWDAVGLVCGDPEQQVHRILLAVDPAPVVVEEAREWGADLIVVHHPLLLKAVHSVAADTPKGRIVHDLVTNGCALFAAHTNADAPAFGVNEALALAIGIQEPRVILADVEEPVDKLVVFVPERETEAVRIAIANAGAGAIGDYDSASFSSVGEGRFRPLPGAKPALGRVGDLEVVAETRIESVVPRARRQQVIAAMRAAHPYEEPAFDIVEMALGPGKSPSRGMGRIGRLGAPTTLNAFAEQVRRVLPPTAHGVRVAGDPERMVSTVAVTSGAGDFLLERVLETEADVYVTSDLRHHRAGEFLEFDGPALLDVAHWAAEWTWLPVLEQKLAETLVTGGDTVETRVSTTCTNPWSFRL